MSTATATVERPNFIDWHIWDLQDTGLLVPMDSPREQRIKARFDNHQRWYVHYGVGYVFRKVRPETYLLIAPYCECTKQFAGLDELEAYVDQCERDGTYSREFAKPDYE